MLNAKSRNTERRKKKNTKQLKIRDTLDWDDESEDTGLASQT